LDILSFNSFDLKKKKTKKQKNKKTIPKKKFDFVFDSKNSVQNFSFKK